MSDRIIRPDSTIGNVETPAPEIARTGAFSAGSTDTSGAPIGLPGSNAEPGFRATLLRMAGEWHRAGFAVHPAKADGSKTPKPYAGAGKPDGNGGYGFGWKRFSTGEAPRLDLARLLAECRGSVDGLGVFCGPASGELEMVELEGRAVDLVHVLAARADERGIGDLWRRIDSGFSEQSPSGGIHWLYRVSDGPALGNVKLALAPGPGGEVSTIAETRGRGGWVVVAGSGGRTHKSGRPYVVRTGSPATVASITSEERDAIHALFRTLDKLPDITSPPTREPVKRDRPEGELYPGEDFNGRATWAEVFPAAWARIEQGDTSDAWSKHGSGGRKSADVFHDSSTVYIYATGVPGSGQSLSKFGAYAWLHHGGDFKAAASALYALGYGSRRKTKPQATPDDPPAVRVETHQPPAELVPIDQYRRDLGQAIAESVLDGTPGVRLLRGAPGTGKTTAVARAMARYPSGVISVPGHELAGEVVERLREAGADAAAYPRLDDTTCGNYEAASRAQAAGLSVSATVCQKCPLLAECREHGYRAGVKVADQAAHKVVTHARLSRSAERLTKNAAYVVLEEDPTTALRPTVSATRRELERLGDLADELATAERRWWILEGAESVADAVAEPVADFAAWAPEPVQGWFTNAEDSNGKSPSPDAPRRRTARAYPRGFFGSCCRIADELSDALADAVLDDTAVGVRELHIRPAGSVPKNPEGEIWRGVEMLERFDPDAAAGISGEALRLVVAIATGRIRSVFVQVEADARPGATRRTAEVVGVWQTQLDWLKTPVYVNDGTCDLDTIRRLMSHKSDAATDVLGDMFHDITPSGSAPLLHAAIQYPHDITPSTSSAKVAAILAGIARANPDKPLLGVILHQRHYRAIVEADDSPLPSDVRSRLAWATYFGSGADRGTNTLHQVADLAVVIGTYRPPPAEIRRTLLRWCELEAAGSTPTWGRVDRRSHGADGGVVAYSGRGYAETAWARAADAVTRAAMRQAVGRARAICPDGVGVVAVTTEATGLPVAEAGSLPVADLRLDELVAAVAGALADARDGVENGPSEGGSEGLKTGPENRAVFPTRYIGDSARYSPPRTVGLADVAKRLPGVSTRSLQVWLSDAVEAGLVVRSGSARATRYGLPVVAAEPRIVAEPLDTRGPAVAPAAVSVPPVVAVSVAPAKPATVHVEPLRSPVPPPEPVARPLTLARVAPPPVIVESPPGPHWLADAVSPSRHSDELLALRFFMSGPYADQVGQGEAWREETPPLVQKLHRAATVEARRRGQPPPPVDVVAGHTVSWYVAAAG